MTTSSKPFQFLITHPEDLDMQADKRTWRKRRDSYNHDKDLYLDLKGDQVQVFPKNQRLFEEHNLVEFLDDVNTDLMQKIAELDEQKEEVQEKLYDLTDDFAELHTEHQELLAEHQELLRLYNQVLSPVSYTKYGPNKRRKVIVK